MEGSQQKTGTSQKMYLSGKRKCSQDVP